jgi:hypothetical protein
MRGIASIAVAVAWVGFASVLSAQVVTTNSDSGPGSLRQTIADAPSGATVTFDGSLSGQTISITNGRIHVARSVVIDASALAAGVILNGYGRSALFHCGSQTTNTFIGLTLTGGYSTQGGGALLNDSILTLNDCTFTGNTANEGGAIFQFTSTTLNNCTIVSNTARYGGGFENDGGTLTLNNCTVAHNIATNDGGGILNMFTTVLNNCTVVSNEAFWGGGISNCDTLYLSNCIVAGNTAGSPSTDQIAGSIDRSDGFNITSGDPMLAPLGDHGGRTHTMPPLPGSPAMDPVGGHTNSVFATDQRGFPRVVNGIVDAGAVEAQAAAMTPPGITSVAMLGDGVLQLRFSHPGGANLQVFATTNAALPVGNWPMIGTANEIPPGSGLFEFTDPDAANLPRRVYGLKLP